MIAVVQRVSSARVLVEEQEISTIGPGYLAFVGAVNGDGAQDAEYVERRLATLRLFPDTEGRMNLSLADVGGAILLVSQFTLAADTRRGRRPSFGKAMAAPDAEGLLDTMVGQLRKRGLRVETGRFGANMQVELVNDGPVTIVIDSRERTERSAASGERS